MEIDDEDNRTRSRKPVYTAAFLIHCVVGLLGSSSPEADRKSDESDDENKEKVEEEKIDDEEKLVDESTGESE